MLYMYYFGNVKFMLGFTTSLDTITKISPNDVKNTHL
jgi:hypothetical protein